MAQACNINAPRSILVRAVNWLGDAVMTTPALGAIRAAFPEARITVLAVPLVAELFSYHPYVDKVEVYDRKSIHRGVMGRLRLARRLREQNFDLAILLQNAIDAAFIAWLARIPRRMGYRTDGRGFLLTHGCPMTDDVRRLHHVDYYLTMLKHFGIVGGEKALLLATTPAEDEAAASLLAEKGITGADIVVGINPGATYGSAKRWYPERFADVAQQLVREWGARIVVLGGTAEQDIAGEIAARLGDACLDTAGKTDVRSLMALIKRCDFLVTNDSGPMHIAAAFDVPLVAIFGPTDHTTTSPWNDRAMIVRKDCDCAPCLKRECPTDHRCMLAVTVDDVVTAARRLRTEISARTAARR
jgi:heptosyltransferase-2